MDAHASPGGFELDPLIAEAKRRMHRRRLLAGLALVLAVAAAVILALRPWNGGNGPAAGAAASRPGITEIPGMTRVVGSSSVPRSLQVGCPDLYPRGHRPPPPRCSVFKLRSGRYEAWILTTAYEQGSRLNVSAAFARAHPGPVIVTDQWLRLASARQAEQLLRKPDFNKSYTGRPAAAVNGGVARFMKAFYFGAERVPAPEIEFFWASGPTVVNVNVVGADLTVAEAQRIALLARPR